MFDEDRSQFFDPRDFAVVAVFTRAGEPLATANVIFNDPSHTMKVEGTALEEGAPFLLAQSDAVSEVMRKDEVAVDGEGDFVVERVHPDGTGTTLLVLSEA